MDIEQCLILIFDCEYSMSWIFLFHCINFNVKSQILNLYLRQIFPNSPLSKDKTITYIIFVNSVTLNKYFFRLVEGNYSVSLIIPVRQFYENEISYDNNAFWWQFHYKQAPGFAGEVSRNYFPGFFIKTSVIYTFNK